jgi:hypothetical protein
LPLAAAYEQVDDYLNAQRWFYVNCWHMNDHESYLMWKAYGGRGFAVVTTLERLQASFDQTPPVVTGGVVQYVDFARELTAVGNVFDHVAMKDLPYRDEREYRLVFWEVDPRNADYPREAAGVRVKVDIPMLVQRIVRSPYPKPIDVDLERLLEGHKQKFGASTISPRSA